MNVQFGFLFSRELSCGLNGFLLSVETARYAIRAGLTYGPFPISGNDVLCSSTHFWEEYDAQDGRSTERWVRSVLPLGCTVCTSALASAATYPKP